MIYKFLHYSKFLNNVKKLINVNLYFVQINMLLLMDMDLGSVFDDLVELPISIHHIDPDDDEFEIFCNQMAIINEQNTKLENIKSNNDPNISYLIKSFKCDENGHINVIFENKYGMEDRIITFIVVEDTKELNVHEIEKFLILPFATHTHTKVWYTIPICYFNDKINFYICILLEVPRDIVYEINDENIDNKITLSFNLKSMNKIMISKNKTRESNGDYLTVIGDIYIFFNNMVKNIVQIPVSNRDIMYYFRNNANDMYSQYFLFSFSDFENPIKLCHV